MLVAFEINGEIVYASYDKTLSSGFVRDMLENLGPDIVIPIPQQYSDIATNYVSFIDEEKQPIYSKEQMVKYLSQQSYFDDETYLKYLVSELLSNWSYMVTVPYTALNVDIQYDVFLYLPYEFVPERGEGWYFNNELFSKEWMKINTNSKIVVNGNEEHHCIRDGKIVRIYCTIDGQRVGSQKTIRYYDNGNLTFEEQRVNDKLQGVRKYWYRNPKNTLERIGEYVNGKKQGLWKTWHNNPEHTLESEGLYINDRKQGSWKYWYDNPEHTLRMEGKYNNGMKRGHWIEYDDSGDILFEKDYDV